MLDSVRRDCAAAGEPDLSAFVVDKATGLPGSFEDDVVVAGEPNERRWREELQRIRSHRWA